MRIQRFRESVGCYAFTAFNTTGKEMGTVRLYSYLRFNGERECYTHSHVYKQYRNKGVGLALYTAAIRFALKYNWRVGSSYHPSDDGRRMWKSSRLREEFRIFWSRKHKRYIAEKKI